MGDPVLESHRVHIRIQRDESERMGDFMPLTSD
jgi:hypothetical protein